MRAMKLRIVTLPDGTAVLYANTLVVLEADLNSAEATGTEPPIHWMPAAHDITRSPIVRYMASAYYEGRVVIETAECSATLQASFEVFDRVYTAYLEGRPRFAFNN